MRKNHDCGMRGHLFFTTFGGDEVCQACGHTEKGVVSLAKAERDEAMAAVDDAADDDWKIEADAAIATFAKFRIPFIGDDIWELLDRRGVARPREMRALGPRIQAAVKRGVIERTGATRPSIRSHLSDKPVFIGTERYEV